MVPHLGHTELIIIVVVAAAGVYIYMAFVRDNHGKMLKQSLLNLSDDYLHVVSSQLTFAGSYTFKPPVINDSVPCTSTVLEPSTSRSATTDSAGFLERAALRACHRVSDRWGDGCDWPARYKLAIR